MQWYSLPLFIGPIMRDHCYRYSLPVLCIIVVAFVLQAILLPAQTPTAVGKLPIAELQKQADAGDPAAQVLRLARLGIIALWIVKLLLDPLWRLAALPPAL